MFVVKRRISNKKLFMEAVETQCNFQQKQMYFSVRHIDYLRPSYFTYASLYTTLRRADLDTQSDWQVLVTIVRKIFRRR